MRWSWALSIACVLALSASVVAFIGCNKKEAGPRPDAVAERACRFGPSVGLDEFCDQDAGWRDACARFATYDAALEHAVTDCAQTGFPVALGDCDLRVIERSLQLGGTLYYYDPEDGELVGIRTFTDQIVTCLPGSPREQSEPVITAGRAPDDDCDTCHLCGRVLDDEREVCAGALATPYVEQCRDDYEFPAGCDECICGACYPWTFGGIEDAAPEFHECVSDHCAGCAQPGDEDAGIDPTDADGGS